MKKGKERSARVEIMHWGITIFLGAFLLFQVQPILGRFVLPWFGGGPGVWTVCLLFFQVFLLAGYFYAHVLTEWVPRRRQAVLHGVLLVLSFLFLPLGPDPEVWKPVAGQAPTGRIFLLLFVNAGVPYLLLAATSPLLQRWFTYVEAGRSPYRLYALSNAGSLLALVSYPFWFEPRYALGVQSGIWSWLYVGLAVAAAGCAWRVGRVPGEAGGNGMPEDRGRPPSAGQVGVWIVLAACGSALLMATTNQMCQEVAVVPFLWVVPLALYLLTFIICFDHPRWYVRRLFGPLLVVAVTLALFLLFGGSGILLWRQILGYSACLFIACMVCHGELVLSKPEPGYLTGFYLAVAAGGALGGLCVAVLAPLLFPDFWEFPLALLLVCVLAAWTSRTWFVPTGHDRGRAVLLFAAVAWFLAAAFLFSVYYAKAFRYAVVVTRNFYGTLRVEERNSKLGPFRAMRHGTILHGVQLMDEDKRRWPIAYYHEETGVHLCFAGFRREGEEKRVGVVGLGTGAIAALVDAGDTVRFYEINPEVVRLAQAPFTFLEDSRADVEVLEGDARIVLEQEWAESGSQQFDLLVLDAFTSDAIPVHLLTEECVRLYLAHLKPDGLLVMHISNRLLDLSPVVRGLADRLDCDAAFFENPHDPDRGRFATSWAVMTRDGSFLERPEVRKRISPWPEHVPEKVVWTDQYSSLWPLLAR